MTLSLVLSSNIISIGMNKFNRFHLKKLFREINICSVHYSKLLYKNNSMKISFKRKTLKMKIINFRIPLRDGEMVSVPVAHAVGRDIASRLRHTKDHREMVQTVSLLSKQVLG